MASETCCPRDRGLPDPGPGRAVRAGPPAVRLRAFLAAALAPPPGVGRARRYGIVLALLFLATVAVTMGLGDSAWRSQDRAAGTGGCLSAGPVPGSAVGHARHPAAGTAPRHARIADFTMV